MRIRHVPVMMAGMLALSTTVGCDAVCDASLSSRSTSPNGEHTAIAYVRSCAAFDRYRSQVSIMSGHTEAPVPTSRGNVFSGLFADSVTLRWLSNDSLLVEMPSLDRSGILRREWNGVAVVFAYSQIVHTDRDTATYWRLVGAVHTVQQLRDSSEAIHGFESFFSSPERAPYRESFLDAWGRPPSLTLSADSLIVISAGADGEFGSGDDIRVTDPAR